MALLTRRNFLTGAAAASAAGCAARRVPVSVDRGRKLAPVQAAPERVIRTVAGLRPFRPSGFVVKAEKLDTKLLVHNYGHGGGGISLSWGTAHLAAEELLQTTGPRRAAVLGCGGVGLATARLLQRRGWDVTIYAKDLPPQTTSNVAGAYWSPVTVFDEDTSTPQFMDQFNRAQHLAHRYFQLLVGDYFGVRWMEVYRLQNHAFARPLDSSLYPGGRELASFEHPFHFEYVRRFHSMLIEPPIYLNALMRDFLLSGGRIVVREFQEAASVAQLAEPVIVNCTGLGSRELFHDPELTPVKGQLTFLLPQAEVDYMVLAGELYMFPRRDGILLGGTHQRGVWSLEPDPQAAERILKGHMKLFGEMR